MMCVSDAFTGGGSRGGWSDGDMKLHGIDEMKLPTDRIRRVFIFTFIFGILAHGSMMTNTILWHDGLHFARRVKAGSAIALGRWMRAILAYAVSKAFGGNNLGMPLLYGMVSIFFIAASALVIIRIFDIKNGLMQAAVCGLMVSLPVVTSTLFYMYTAPYYFLGLFLSTAAVLIARECGGVKGFVLATLCVSFTLGIYQAYLAVAVSLFVMTLIFDIINDRYPGLPSFFRSAFYALGICVLGFAAYMVVWKVLMRVLGLSAANYQDISALGSKGIATYLEGIRAAYARFFLIFDRKSENLYPMGLRWVQVVILALSAVLSVWIVVLRFRKDRLQGVALVLLIALLPLCFNLVYMIGAKSVHTVMLYGQCMLYVYLICVVGYLAGQGGKTGVSCRRVVAAVLLLMVAMNIYFDNGCYMKAEMTLQQTINNMTVLTARIKSLDGYRDEMPVCIAIRGKQDATVTQDGEMQDFIIAPLGHLIPHSDNGALRNIKNTLAQWCGFSPKYVSEGKLEHPEVLDDMPDYPDAGSVRIVDDTVVVRM